MIRLSRQRQQGRDAAELARRRACRACSTRSRVCLAAGAPGITVHPRADRRHITPDDVRDDRARCCGRCGRRSSSTSKAIRGRNCSTWCDEVRPDQCTLVPVVPGEVTSQAGWQPGPDADRLPRRDREPARQRGIRVSLFVDADAGAVRLGGVGSAPTGSSSTPSRSRARSSAAPTRRARVVRRVRGRGATLAHALGLGVNAGHDLDLDNLVLFRDAAASRRGVDRPRHHRRARCSSASTGRPRVPATSCARRMIAGSSRIRYDRSCVVMKSDAIAFGVAGIVFGLIAGWIIGSQQATARRPPPRRPPQPRRPRRRRRSRRRRRARRSAGRPPQDRSPSASRRTPRRASQLGEPLLRRRALRRSDQVVRGGAEARTRRTSTSAPTSASATTTRTSRTRRSSSSTSRSRSIRSTPRRC